MPLERYERVEVVRYRKQCAGLRRGGAGQKGCENHAALGESPAPRLRCAAPFPDRVRHSRALAEQFPVRGETPVNKLTATASAMPAANRMTLTSRRLAP